MEDLHNIGVGTDSLNRTQEVLKIRERWINWTRLRASVHQMKPLREGGWESHKGGEDIDNSCILQRTHIQNIKRTLTSRV